MAARPPVRIALNVVIDGAVAALAVPLARAIADPSGDWLHPPWLPAAGAATLLLAGLPFRLPWQFWRFSGMDDLLAVAWSSAAGAALLAFVLALTGAASGNPAFPVVYALTLLVLLGAPRIVYRRWRHRRDGTLPGSFAPDIPSALVVGATEDIDLFLRALAWDRRRTLQVEGLLAVGARQTGRRIHGCPFLGSIEDTAAVLERLAGEGRLPDTMVVTTPDLAGQSLAVLVEQAEAHGMRIRRAPRPTSLDAAATPNRARELELRPMAIEDLLNRAQVPLDREGMARLIQGRRVIVTGAGGTIGSELARQVAALGPERLILLDNGEYALWLIDLELAERHPHVPRESLLADIRDEARVRDLFEQWRPELVFHAAALKHVPMVEANPLEGLLTNVAGTRHVADAARACRRAGDGADLHRQGGEPDLGDGRIEAAGRDVLPGAGHRRPRLRPRHALHHRALRQRAGQYRLGGAAVPAPVGARRPADRHASRHAALLHDGARGGGPGAAGERDRRRRCSRCRRARRAASSCSTWATR